MNARADEPVEVVNLDIAEANEYPLPFHPRAGDIVSRPPKPPS